MLVAWLNMLSLFEFDIGYDCGCDVSQKLIMLWPFFVQNMYLNLST